MGAMPPTDDPHPRMTDRPPYDEARLHRLLLDLDEAKAAHRTLDDRREHLRSQINRLTLHAKQKYTPRGDPVPFSEAHPQVYAKVARIRSEISSVEAQMSANAPRRAALQQLASACRKHVNRLEQAATTRTPAVDVGAEPQLGGAQDGGA